MNRNLIVGVIILVLAAGVGFTIFSGEKEPASLTAAAKEEHHDEENHGIELTAEKIAKGGIIVEVAGPAVVRDILPLYGTIVPNAERMRDVAARFPGTIRSAAKKIGDSVKQGETLAVIESNESLQTYSLTARWRRDRPERKSRGAKRRQGPIHGRGPIGSVGGNIPVPS